MYTNTLWDRIVPDLLPIIDEYSRAFLVFAIGDPNVSHDDYRLVCNGDLKNEEFFVSFKKYYYENNGLPSLDFFKGGILNYLDGEMLIDGYYVRCTLDENINYHDYINIHKGVIIPFKTSKRVSKELWMAPSSIWGISRVDSFKVDLLVRKDATF